MAIKNLHNFFFVLRNLPVIDLDSSSESLPELSESLDESLLLLIKPIQPMIRRNCKCHTTIKIQTEIKVNVL